MQDFMNDPAPNRWALDGGAATVWKVEGAKLPHSDAFKHNERDFMTSRESPINHEKQR
jgi:hypothetical protein